MSRNVQKCQKKVLKGQKRSINDQKMCLRNTWMAPKHRAMVHQDERVPELKKYPCEQCDKVFNSSNRLKLHIEGKHLNIKRFGCEACGYRTNDRCRLKDHINIMHEKKPMNCKFCDFMCYSKTIYGKHMRKFHKPPKKIIKVDAYQ